MRFGRVVGVSSVAVYECASRVSEKGIDVHLIALSDRNESRQWGAANVAIHTIESLPLYYLNALTLTRLKFLAFAKKVLERIKPDIVHVYAGTGMFLLPATIPLNCKWVNDIRSVSVVSNPVIRRMHDLDMQIEAGFFDRNLVVDKEIAQAALGRLPATEFPLGVNLDLFRRTEREQARASLGLAEDELALVYSGTMHPFRRLERLLEAFELASASDPSLRLVMLGDARPSDLREVAEQMGLGKKVIFFGPVSYDQVPRCLSACDIGISYIPISDPYYVQPSLKALEYLACGLPTLATNTMGNRKTIVSEVNGILSSDDPRAFARSILRLTRDDDLRNRLSQSARASVERFDWERLVGEKLIPVYQQLTRA